MPASTLPSVLFPAPFSPHSAWHDPAATSSVTPSSACTPRNLFVICSKRTAGSLISLHLEILRVDVGEAPCLQLLGPLSKVVLGDADQLHRDHVGHILLRVHFVEDRPHADVPPLEDRLRK